MAIYEPALFLSEADREALLLLGQLVLSCHESAEGNISQNDVALSPSEASRLLELLEQFSESKLFLEGSYFSEGIANHESDTNERLRGIYLHWRSRRGNSGAAPNYTWREFTLRAGFNFSPNAWIWPGNINRSPVRPMTLEHFLAMEKRLVSVSGLHPRVGALITALVSEQISSLSDIRSGKLRVKEGSLKKSVTSFRNDLSDHIAGTEKSPMNRRRIIAISTIIIDTAALFSTRDWTATGVLSSIAALTPDAFMKSSSK